MLLRSWLGAALLTASVSLAALALLRNSGPSTARAEARTSGLEIEIEMPALKQAANVAAPPAASDALLLEPPVRPQVRRPAPFVARPTAVPDLAQATGWMKSIAVHEALPKLASPEAERARLEDALSKATNPVARQNVIFLAVLTLPADVSHPWLSSMIGGGLGGDAEDALAALAFDGDAACVSRFSLLARASSPAPVRRLLDTVGDHEALGQAGTDEARDVLRSYRAIEVLDREPYFEITFHLVSHAEWLAHPARTADLDRELLASWLARYPGHPGSDDMAVRLGRLDTLRGEHYAAARWYSRAATMPDQDLCDVAVEDLVATCELLLTPEDLDRLANEQGYSTPNRELMQYIRLRRLAAERGFDVALMYAAAVGRDEPLSVIGYSWNHRYAAPVPKGLDSGLAPAPPDDPLRAMQEPAPPLERPERVPLPVMQIPTCLENQIEDDQSRLDPWPERLQLDETLLMRQFRAWEAIATLDLRAARVRGDARADLLYRQAAIFYHEPRSIFPAYGWVGSLRGVFRHVTSDEGKDLEGFACTSYPLRRAIRVFEQIEIEHPTYAGMDKVLYSKGTAWAKLTRFGYWREGIRNAVFSLERCALLFPKSPLADDAALAVAYWHKEWPHLFE